MVMTIIRISIMTKVMMIIRMVILMMSIIMMMIAHTVANGDAPTPRIAAQPASRARSTTVHESLSTTCSGGSA